MKLRGHFTWILWGGLALNGCQSDLLGQKKQKAASPTPSYDDYNYDYKDSYNNEKATKKKVSDEGSDTSSPKSNPDLFPQIKGRSEAPLPWDPKDQATILQESGVGQSAIPPFDSVYADSQATPHQILSALVFGGSGIDGEGQTQVAGGMVQACGLYGCDLAIPLGDMFYPTGMKTAEDQAYRDKWELPYQNLNVPVYPVLGISEYGGISAWNSIMRASLHIEPYTSIASVNNHWQLPSSYYDFIQGDTHFLMIDTLGFDEQQHLWLKNKLESTTAKWRLVFGYNNLEKSNKISLDTIWPPKILDLLCQKATAYFFGEDQWLQIGKAPCGLSTIASGAASQISKGTKAQQTIYINESSLGFVRLAISPVQINAQVLDQSGAEIFSTTLAP